MTSNSRPIRCEAEYVVWENEREKGIFMVGDIKIGGYRVWENKSSVTLIWTLPESQQDAVSVLESLSWADNEISYDDMDGLDASRGIGSSDFYENGNELEEVEDFEGDCEETSTEFGSDYGPSAVHIYYDDGHHISFERKGESMCLTFPEEEMRSFSDYNEFMEEVKQRILSNN